ncbi:MAG: hypothetical protein QXX68_02835 [Candidatus Pacearchaeota archaeon]
MFFVLIFALLSIFAFFYFNNFFSFTGYTIFAGGSGTLEDPYQISNCSQLQNMKFNLSAYYVLGNDVDCSETINWNEGLGFEPIGNETNHFRGSFDGRNFTINGLYINRTNLNYVGLFGYSSGNISNVGLVNGNVSGSSYVCGLVGWQYRGTISNSFAITNKGFVCNNREYLRNSQNLNANCFLTNHSLFFRDFNISFVNANFSFINSNLSYSNSNLSILNSNLSLENSTIINSNFNLNLVNSSIELNSLNSSIQLNSLNSTINYNLTETNIILFSNFGRISFLTNITSQGNNLEEIYKISVNQSFNFSARAPYSFNGTAFFVFINSSKDSNFNKSANITFDLRGWKISYGRILRNGQVCNETTNPSCFSFYNKNISIRNESCNKTIEPNCSEYYNLSFVSQNNGLVNFNVSSWSQYGINGSFERICGNGVLDEEFGEVYDGNDFGGRTCSNFGNFNAGSLSCSNDCLRIITSGCYY